MVGGFSEWAWKPYGLLSAVGAIAHCCLLALALVPVYPLWHCFDRLESVQVESRDQVHSREWFLWESLALAAAQCL